MHSIIDFVLPYDYRACWFRDLPELYRATFAYRPYEAPSFDRSNDGQDAARIEITSNARTDMLISGEGGGVASFGMNFSEFAVLVVRDRTSP